MRLCLFFIAVILSINLSAQGRLNYIDYGIYAGVNYASSDIARELNFDAVLRETRPQFGFTCDYFFNSHIGLGAKLGYTSVHSSDAYYDVSVRDYSSTSHIFLSDFRVILHLKPFGRFRIKQSYTPYIFAGGGFGAFQTSSSSQNVAKEDSWTPGIATHGFITGGAGVKFRSGYNTNWSVELVLSRLPSDRIEGFLNANSQHADYFGGMRLTFSLLTTPRPGEF